MINSRGPFSWVNNQGVSQNCVNPLLKCRHRRKPQKSAYRCPSRLRHEGKSRKLPRHTYWLRRAGSKYNVMIVFRLSQRCSRRFLSSGTRHYVEGRSGSRSFETKRDSSGISPPLKMRKIYFLETVFMQTYNPRRTQKKLTRKELNVERSV